MSELKKLTWSTCRIIFFVRERERERELVVFEVINKFKFLCCSFTTDGRGDVVTLKEKHSRLSKQLNAHSESSTTLSEIEVMFD